MIHNHRWREKAGELEPAMAVRSAHHGNLDTLVAEPSDTSRPFSFDCGSTLELEAELAKEINRRREVIDDDSYVVHPFNSHMSTDISDLRMCHNRLLHLALLPQEGGNIEIVLRVVPFHAALHRFQRMSFMARNWRRGRRRGSLIGGMRARRSCRDERRSGARISNRRGGAHGGMCPLRHGLESGSDDGDLHLVLHLLVVHGAEDDVGVFMRSALDDG